MDKQKLTEEMNSYSISELEAICETQGECYTDEEMRLIVQILEQKQQERKTDLRKFDARETICCIAGLLLPLVGLVIGICMLLSNDPASKKTGKRTLIAVFISVMLLLFLNMGGFVI